MTSIVRAIRISLRLGTWTYLASYVTQGDSVGRVVATRITPIDSAEEVKDVEAWLGTMDAPGAVLTGVTLLKRRRFERWPAEFSPTETRTR